MTVEVNPYNYARPGNLYVGHERLRRRIVERLRDGQSFAIIGGRRCGKTSTLLKLTCDVEESDQAPYRMLARSLRASELGTVTTEALFEEIYRLAVDGVGAGDWRPGRPGQAYRAFLDNIVSALPQIEETYGNHWVVILMVDEIDALACRLQDEVFFQNIRNLLMDSDFSRHFRLIATGVNDLSGLIRSGSSPLNNLSIQQLGIIGRRNANRLVEFGFPNNLPDDGIDKLELLTGRHPYLLQGILQHLWMDRDKGLGRKEVSAAAREFLRERRDFKRWLETFGEAERAVYLVLGTKPDLKADVREIRDALPRSLAGGVDEALVVLSTHGVINDRDPDEPRIAGALFHDWFRAQHAPAEETVKQKEIGTPSEVSVGGQPQATVNFNPTVNPTIIVGQTVTITTASEALPVIDELKSMLDSLDLDPRKKTEMENELRTAKTEVEIDKGEGSPDKNRIAQSIEQATKVLKSAEGGVGALHAFIEKAQKLAPYVGQAGNWLSAMM